MQSTYNFILVPTAPDIFPGSYAIAAPSSYRHLHNQPIGQTSSPESFPASLGPTPIALQLQPVDTNAQSETTLGAPIGAMLPAPAESWKVALKDIFTLKCWTNPILWKAGLIEFTASIPFVYLTGALGVTLSTYPPHVVGPCLFFANTAVVSLFIYAVSTATGAHINPLISFATAVTGLCHPVRSIIYIGCQLAGSIIGGSFLRGGLGYERAMAVHNGGCWRDPNGPVSVGQAVCIEFISTFCMLFVAFGVGLDPRQKELYGASFGPLLVGMTVGVITSFTSALQPGYTGASMFPGRCLGLQLGLGFLDRYHWIWWVPDVAAVLILAVVYHFAPPYTRQRRPSNTEKANKIV
ncbi:hypothetical protein FRC02_008994 [Tulasnella sp. 418]|nr:hypothetical protein FRC02_008994 [Tulasnella sp. 418]